MARFFLCFCWLQQDFAALQREAAALRQAFAAETKNKNERESLACKKLGEFQLLVDSKFEAEIAVRQEQLNLIKREVERLVKYVNTLWRGKAIILVERAFKLSFRIKHGWSSLLHTFHFSDFVGNHAVHASVH